MSAKKYSCQGCTRSDLTLTANGKTRSHAANGKRVSADNPACGMGSEWPLESTEFHTHVFTYADDDNGHSGSFCECGLVEPEDVPAPEAGPPAPPNPFRDPLPGGVHDNAGRAHVVTDPVTHDAVMVIPDSEDPRERLGTCTRCGEPRDGHAHEDTPQGARPVDTDPDAFLDGAAGGNPARNTDPDAFLDGAEDDPDAGESDGSGPRYFASRYDGTCVTCLDRFEAGDMIRRDPEGGRGYEGEDCCGEENQVRPERPKAVARTLPVTAGRYRFPHPVTGKPTSGQRASKFAEGVQDKYALDQWKGRMIVLGMTIRPDLIEKAQSALRNEDPAKVAKLKRDYLNKVAEDARLAAGSKTRAKKGTQLHAYTEELDGGTRTLAEVPEDYRRDAEAYVAALAEAGFRPVLGLIERSVYCDELGVTGTFDRVLMCIRDTEVVDLDGRPVAIREGEFVIGDVKSGDNIESPWLEILVQEAIYAHAVNENGIAVQDEPGGPWRWSPLAEQGVGKVREDVGIVMHIPYGTHECKLYFADLITGWRGAKLCKQTRDFWKIKLPKQPVMSTLIAEAVTEDDSIDPETLMTRPDLPAPESFTIDRVPPAPEIPEDDRVVCFCGSAWDTIEIANAYDHDYEGCGPDPELPAPTPEPPAKNIMEAVHRAKHAVAVAHQEVRSILNGSAAPADEGNVEMPTTGHTWHEWEEKFRAAKTREEANETWREAKEAGVTAEEIKRLIPLVKLSDQGQAAVSRPASPTPARPAEKLLPVPETKPQSQDRPNLTDRAHAVTTREEASKIFKEARAKIEEMEPGDRPKAQEYLKRLTKIMADRLAAA